MKMVLLPAAVIALFAGAAIAYAADATGKIKTIDTTKSAVTLDNGATYSAPSTVKLSDLKIGEKVTVDYTASNGKMQINTIKPAT
jgi:Cu/Ag efflux protein CusF